MIASLERHLTDDLSNGDLLRRHANTCMETTHRPNKLIDWMKRGWLLAESKDVYTAIGRFHLHCLCCIWLVHAWCLVPV